MTRARIAAGNVHLPVMLPIIRVPAHGSRLPACGWRVQDFSPQVGSIRKRARMKPWQAVPRQQSAPWILIDALQVPWRRIKDDRLISRGQDPIAESGLGWTCGLFAPMLRSFETLESPITGQHLAIFHPDLGRSVHKEIMTAIHAFLQSRKIIDDGARLARKEFSQAPIRRGADHV